MVKLYRYLFLYSKNVSKQKQNLIVQDKTKQRSKKKVVKKTSQVKAQKTERAKLKANNVYNF